MNGKAKKIPKGFALLWRYCRDYYDARDRVSERVEEIRQRRIKYTRRLMPGLHARLAELDEAKDRIREYLEANPQQFVRPRTRALAGCRVGYRKRPGQIEIDPERAIKRIRELMPQREKDLVRTKETLVKPALRNLSAAELAALGGRMVEVDDEVVIAVPKDTLAKLVDALLDGFENDLQEAA